jgi:DNA-binding CsgD family transcriptional regulator
MTGGEAADLMSALESVGEKYGLTRFGYLANLRDPMSSHDATPVIETNFSPSWQERYTECRYDKVDPLVQIGMKSFLPIDWSEVRGTNKEVRQFFGEAEDFGLFKNGIGIPIRDHKNRTAVFSVNTDMGINEWRLFSRSYISDITYLGFLFHSQIAARYEQEGACREDLSERERVSLEWAARGKTSWETAQILGVSARTVDFHIKNSIRKLLAANKTQAVAIAVSENLILI